MKGIKINVSNNIAQITEKPQRIIAGTVGLPVEYTFDSHWDGLVKYAVFAAGKKLMMFEIENTAVIPWEVLRKPGQQLMIGVYGEHPDGTEALPTVWANAGVIRHGAVPGTAPGIPSPPPVWESIKNSIGELDELNTEHKETLVGAINEVADMAADKEVFVAEYEVTPIEEIVDAHNAGKAIVCKHGGLLLPLVQRDRNIATFSGFYNGNLHVIVNNNGEWRWTTDSYVKAVEVRNVDHDDTIPTERAVWQKIFEREEAIRTEVPLIANRVSTPSGYGFDKTYAEIKEAVAAGRTILLNNYDVLYAMSGSGPNYYKFIPFVTANTDVSKPGLKVNSSDVWSEVATGVEPMTEEKVKTLIEENGGGGITEDEVKTLIEENAPDGGLLVTVDYTQNGPIKTYYTDVDFDTIVSAVNKKPVILRCWKTYGGGPSGKSGYQYYMFWGTPNPGWYDFISLATVDGTYEIITLKSDGSVTFTTYDMPVLKTTAQELTDSQKEQVKTNLGISGGGSTPDWNASEGETGHILNRTHYAEDVTFFSMTDATFNPDTQFMTEIEIDGELFVGRKYKVIWDGQEYECTAVDFFGDGSVNLGSDAIFGGTSTEPFMFMLDAQTGSKMLIDMESMMNGATEPVTHSVTLLGISYKTFDPNYVPPVDWDSGDGCIPIRNQPFKRNLICVFEWDGDTTDKVTIQTHQDDNTGVTVHMCRIASASDVVNAMCFEAETEDAVSGGYMFTPLSPMLDLGESGKNMCGSDFMYTIYSESVAVRNSRVYVKKDNKTDAFGLTQEGVYLQYALNNTGNKTQFVRKVKLYSVDATIPSYLGTRTCLHNVYATGLKLRSNGKLWEITVDDSGNLTATEVTN